MTALLRYVELFDVAGETSVIHTRRGRWLRSSAPVGETAAAIAELEKNGEDSDLARMLIEDGSLETRGAARRPVLVGAPRLHAALRATCPALGRFDGVPNEPDLRGDEIVVVVASGYDEAELRSLGEQCRRAGVAWLPFVVDRGRAWLGPLIEPASPLQIEDFIGRRTVNQEPSHAPGETPDVQLGTWVEPSGADLAWLAAVLAAEVSRYATGLDGRSKGYCLELDPAALTVTRHLVLPMPANEEPTYRQLGFNCQPTDLVDEHTGVITKLVRVTHHPTIPRRLITIHAHTSKMTRIGPWLTDPVAAGTSFESEQHARQAAIGEAAERYSGDLIRADLLREATWHEIVEGGERAVDPDALVLFSKRQYAAPGFPFVPLTKDLRIHWVRGSSLRTGEHAWLPASLVYVNWHVGKYADSPRINNPFYPGIAAGPSLDFAITSAIQEIVERHVTMVWWSNAHPLGSVEPTPHLASLWRDSPDQRAWLISLDNEFGIPVLAGVVEHPDEQLFTIGFAARPDPEDAARKAWAEALTLQDGARDLLRPSGGYRQSIARGEVVPGSVKPWRADRRYLDDFRADFRDVADLMAQLQVYLDPRAADHVRPFVETPVTRSMNDLPRLSGESRAAYQEAVERKGFEIFYADITTRDIECAGLRVVRVLIPGLVPNFAAAFPFHGNGRLRDVAVELGWRSEPLSEDEINVFPMPHA